MLVLANNIRLGFMYLHTLYMTSCTALINSIIVTDMVLMDNIHYTSQYAG